MRPRALGREIAADERSFVELPAADETATPTLYLGMDGTGVPMRASEIKGRAGKQPDGSAKTREVKLVTVWTAQSTDEHGAPVRDSGSITYSAALESAASCDTDDTPSQFAQRADREARRRGFDRAKRRVVLGDGAPWIWNLTEELFPGAIQIVDIYHAKGHLWDVAKAIYGAGSELGEHWAKQRRDELDEGKIGDILAALRVHKHANDEARKCLAYVIRNQNRMRYPQFRGAGLVCLYRSRRGRLQSRHRHPAQTCRHALDRRRGRRHHRAALAASLAAASQTSGSADQQPEPRPALELISQN